MKGLTTMKLALAQISMTENMQENLEKSLLFCDFAKGNDLLFFPEIQLSPFFPQYEKRNVDRYCLTSDAEEISRLRGKARQHHYYLSPNVYLEHRGKRYDTSLWITPDGELADTAQMVHIAQAEQFYEQDYYTPSDDGFKVFNTEYGKIGIVVCFDRHYPESVRTEALMGADLILIPTVNTKAEPSEMFEWELRVQAFQNSVAIAMCNRVGCEGQMDFAGESIAVDANGEVVLKTDDAEQILYVDMEIADSGKIRKSRLYTELRRMEFYR